MFVVDKRGDQGEQGRGGWTLGSHEVDRVCLRAKIPDNIRFRVTSVHRDGKEEICFIEVT